MIRALDARDGKRLAAILRQHLLEKRAALMQIHPAPAGAPALPNA
jgi:DNA-binding GntR family transcriptional regulator